MQQPGTILITGASTGIGRAMAQFFDRCGWKVFAGVRKEADGESLRKECSDRLRTLYLDVTDNASIEAATSAISENGGKLDALVNNAGITVNAPLEFVQLSELRRQFDVNFFGVVAVTQAALPLTTAACVRRCVRRNCRSRSSCSTPPCRCR